MRLIDAEEAERLYAHMGPAREVSGGCAGNTAAGIAALGGRAGFVGQVAPDQLGSLLPARPDRGRSRIHDRARCDVGVPTARSMILVTPDGHRTMNTFLGAAQHLPSAALDEQQIRDSAAIYLEGYLWDPETPRYAMIRAIEIARGAGRKVAFTLSDTFCIERHRDGFNATDRRRADRYPVRQPGRDRDAGRRSASRQRGRGGARQGRDLGRHSRRAWRARDPRRRARRRSGRAGRARSSTRPARATCSPPASCSVSARGLGLEQSLKLGAIAAAEVIQHYGARPEADLRALAGELAA